MNEFTLSRKMRKEFPESEKAKIIELIQENKKNVANEAW